ncbi:MAG: hypothetical protein JKY56_22520 [Kofleriaceae bacterium]|nr:hypothetical protein [Kofleriaceae bacterium]
MKPVKLRNQITFLSTTALLAVACSTSAPSTKKPQGTEVKSDVPNIQATDAASASAPTATLIDRSRLPETGPASAPKSEFVGADDLISRDTLKFASPADAASYDKLEACFVRYGQDWTAYPRRRFGNFVNIEWCRGQGSHINCAGGNTRKAPGAGWSSLEVLQYERTWPQVFGLSFTTGQIPEQEGIAVAFAWTQDGQSVIGDHMSATFQGVQDGKIVSKLTFAMAQGFALGENGVESPTKGTAADLYKRLTASPASLRAEATRQIDGLERAVEEALVADTPRKCVYGPYKGGGIPPRCIRKVPLDDMEKAEARELLERTLAPRRKLVAEHADAMHAGLLALLPAECWTPATGTR